MSYCRSGEDSDVYVYHSMGGGWRIHVAYNCAASGLNGKSFAPRTRRETLNRLLKIREAGYVVPDRALERLRREMKSPDLGSEKP